MWTRRELKEKAKQRVRGNYWKCVLVALLLAVLGGSAAGAGGGYTGVHDTMDGFFAGSGNRAYHIGDNIIDSYDSEEDIDDYDAGDDIDDYDLEDDLDSYEFRIDDDYDGDVRDPFGGFIRSVGEKTAEGVVSTMVILFVVFIVIIVVAVVVLLVVIPLEVFIVNPLEVGIKRFFVLNLREQPGIKEICYSFDHNYMNCVKTLFFRDLFIFLWSLLFIIPGVIKSYEYRMMPYILGETPNISKEEAFELSRIMMMGNKWNAFVLDLSFLGWYILNGLTFGILGIFYVNPYVEQTDAALYQKLKSLRFEQKEQPVNMM